MTQLSWVDAVIQAEIDKGNPKAIAIAVAQHPRFIEAIHRGLAKKPPAGEGPSHARIIADELREALAAE